MRRRIELLTRSGCGLCDELEPRLRRTARRFRVPVEVVDIAQDRLLEDEFHLRIPVVRGPSGRVLAEGSVTGFRLFTAVAAVRWGRG